MGWSVVVWSEEPLFPNSRDEAVRFYFKDEVQARYWASVQLSHGADRAEVCKTIVFLRSRSGVILL